MAKLTESVANAVLDSVTQMLAGGWLDIYADSGALLASLQLDNPAFKSASLRAATANNISPDKKAQATGTPGRYALLNADRKITVQEGTAGGPGSGAELIMNAELIVKGAEVHVDSYVLKVK